VTLTTFAVDAT